MRTITNTIGRGVARALAQRLLGPGARITSHNAWVTGTRTIFAEDASGKRYVGEGASWYAAWLSLRERVLANGGGHDEAMVQQREAALDSHAEGS